MWYNILFKFKIKNSKPRSIDILNILVKSWYFYVKKLKLKLSFWFISVLKNIKISLKVPSNKLINYLKNKLSFKNRNGDNSYKNISLARQKNGPKVIYC